MRVSKFILLLGVFTVIATAFFLYENNKENIGNLDPNFLSKGISLGEAIENRKIVIFLIGFSLILCLLLLYIYFVRKEDKKNPFNNLLLLKKKAILSDEEYELKVKYAKSLKQKEISDNEKKKILTELENLKTKGIINEAEFLEKKKMIQTYKI